MSILVRVSKEPIRHEQVAAELGGREDGAQLVFWGLVRDHNDGRSVRAVTYDAHPQLAVRTFREIADEALARWGDDLRVVIIHRTGTLEVGEASVVVGVASAHRDEAYEASRHVIEQLKVRSPIWKQEHYVDGDSEWLRGHSLRRAEGAA
ncbi:MAG TPA: molybdenum cofactor biosynthesis protein MoaE [Anaeromyxobacteraceae bacterium]